MKKLTDMGYKFNLKDKNDLFFGGVQGVLIGTDGKLHVNGTRGKSSVTRLIAAGLRNGKHKVFAKTTGTEPKFIFPDGTEELISRRGPANIRENIKLIKTAVDNGADTIVFECMVMLF